MSAGTPSLERVIGEAFHKVGSVILAARICGPAKKQQAQQPPGRAWFNLEVDEVEGASQALERWRRDTALPLVVEIVLRPWGAAHASQPDKAETLLERWSVHYYPQLPESPSHLSRSQLSRLNPASVYKRLVITLRSLHTYARVLPAYRMYRACKRQRGANFTLAYRLHSTLPGAAAAAAPGARRMQRFAFGAVDTPYGQLRIAVDYQPASAVTVLEQTASPPPVPRLIADYVGSPAAARARHAPPAPAPGWGGAAGTPSPPTPTHGRGAPPSPRGAGGSPAGGAGAGLFRRSWSSGLRGASPHRALSQPSSELPSPVSAADVPYGSAPHASLPAMLRTLSCSSGRHAVVGSPGAAGRPPLAKPPRVATAPLAAPPGPAHGAHGRAPQLSGSPRSAVLVGALGGAEGGDDEEGGAEEADAEEDGAASAPRLTSAPVRIPGRSSGELAAGGAAARRLRSSGDLWALQQAAAQPKPLSAPAVSHMRPAAARAPGAAELAAAPAPAPAQQQQPGRAPLVPGLEGEGGGSAASSLWPTSCSPQLPFAFTPSAQSLAGFGARGSVAEPGRLERVSPRLGRTLSGTGGCAGAAAAAHRSPGREPGASTALVRRPSWSARSPFAPPSPGDGAGVGYSVSPMRDAALESMLAGSTPRHFTLAAGLPPPLPQPPAPLPPVGRTSSAAAGFSAPPPMITFPSAASPQLSGALDETDALPFALDETSGPSPHKPRSPAAASPTPPPPATSPGLPVSVAAVGCGSPPDVPASRPATEASPESGSARAPPAATAAVDGDVAVGAFVRLIQGAPPLRTLGPRLPARAASADLSAAATARAPPPGTSSGSDSSGLSCASDGRALTLQAGLAQFSRIKQRLQQRGVLVGPLPAGA